MTPPYDWLIWEPHKMADSRLELMNLNVSRGGRRVLHHVSMSVGSGEVVALLGANGAGKSTLVMTCVGAYQADSGDVKFDGKILSGLSPDRIRAQGVVIIPEGHRVLGKLTVRENLEVAAIRFLIARAKLAIDKAVEIFPELIPHLALPASNLSGGQKQMVCIAQALIAGPKILLIDELSLGLAPVVVNRLMLALKAIAAEGVGILLVEQFTTLALSMASRAYLLDLGHMVFEGSSSELQSNPEILHRAYLAANTDKKSQA
jgi:branched-chain amino acid transport system ATP-binding protein